MTLSPRDDFAVERLGRGGLDCAEYSYPKEIEEVHEESVGRRMVAAWWELLGTCKRPISVVVGGLKVVTRRYRNETGGA